MSPDIKLEEHAGCGGIAVSVPSGSVNGGTVLFCLKCMEDRGRRLTRERDDLQQHLSRIAADAEQATVRRICEWLRTEECPFGSPEGKRRAEYIANAIERGDWRGHG